MKLGLRSKQIEGQEDKLAILTLNGMFPVHTDRKSMYADWE